MMSLELANTLSSAVAAIAVVISLIFVGLQLRASVRSQQALAAWQSENSWAQLNFEIARDPQAIELMEKINSPETSVELLQGTQLLQARHAESLVGLTLGAHLDGQPEQRAAPPEEIG